MGPVQRMKRKTEGDMKRVCFDGSKDSDHQTMNCSNLSTRKEREKGKKMRKIKRTREESKFLKRKRKEESSQDGSSNGRNFFFYTRHRKRRKCLSCGDQFGVIDLWKASHFLPSNCCLRVRTWFLGSGKKEF